MEDIVWAESASRRALLMAIDVEFKVLHALCAEAAVVMPAPPEDPRVVAGTALGEYEAEGLRHIAEREAFLTDFACQRRELISARLTRRVSLLRGRSVETREASERAVLETMEYDAHAAISAERMNDLRLLFADVVSAEAVTRVEAQVGALQAIGAMHCALREAAKDTMARLDIAAAWASDIFALDGRARERIGRREQEERGELRTLCRRRYYEASWEAAISALLRGHRTGRDALVGEEAWLWALDFSDNDAFVVGRERLLAAERRVVDVRTQEATALRIWPKVERFSMEEVRARARISDEEAIEIPKPPWRHRRASRVEEAVE